MNAYPPPLPPPLPTSGMASPNGFEPLNGRVQTNKILLILNIVMDAIQVLLSLALALVASRSASQDTLDGIVMVNALTALIQLVLIIATAVAFLSFVKRANLNLRALGVQNLEFTPGWAVGYFFIPIINLFRVPSILGELWKASDPALAPSDSSWKQRPIPSLVNGWWACWVFTGLIARASIRLDDTAYTTGAIADVASGVLSIGAAVLAIRMLETITRLQNEKHAALQAIAAAETPLAMPQMPAYAASGENPAPVPNP